ncbi:MAG: DUF1641 domain-containing protein [Candidatus Nanohaloarchaea archaeon]|nr:DUF1641 domain-containing protein [Candidatus Nanohaloarchaea archaeon]
MADKEEGRFRLDDEVEKALKRFSDQRALLQQVSEPDELVAVLDTVSAHSDAIQDAVESLATIQQTGMLDVIAAAATGDLEGYDPAGDTGPVQDMYALLHTLSEIDTDAVSQLADGMPTSEELSLEEWRSPQRVGLLRALAQSRDPAVQRGLGRVFLLLQALGAESDGG